MTLFCLCEGPQARNTPLPDRSGDTNASQAGRAQRRARASARGGSVRAGRLEMKMRDSEHKRPQHSLGRAHVEADTALRAVSTRAAHAQRGPRPNMRLEARNNCRVSGGTTGAARFAVMRQCVVRHGGCDPDRMCAGRGPRALQRQQRANARARRALCVTYHNMINLLLHATLAPLLLHNTGRNIASHENERRLRSTITPSCETNQLRGHGPCGWRADIPTADRPTDQPNDPTTPARLS